MSTAYAAPACAPIRRAAGSREACLCIHGFCGAPAVFLPLVDTILDAGYDCYAPLLPGHGTRPEDMIDVKLEQWLDTASAWLDELLPRYERVHLLGLSLGGAIASWLAGTRSGDERLGKVMLLVPGYALRNKEFYQMDFEAMGDRLIPLAQQVDLTPELEESAFLYPFMAAKSIGQLLRLGGLALEEVPRIVQPTLMLYTAADPVVDPEVCARAAGELPGLRAAHCYQKSGHNLLLDTERADVAARLEAFLRLSWPL